MAFLGNFLRIMVILSAILLVGGGSLFLISQGRKKIDYGEFHKHTTLQGQGIPLMKAGIGLLALTPLFAMIFSVIAFILKRNTLYAAIALIVVLILTYSLLIAIVPLPHRLTILLFP